MSVALFNHSTSFLNPNPNPNRCCGSLPLKRASMVLCSSHLLRPRCFGVSVGVKSLSPRGLGPGFLCLDRPRTSIFAFEASREDSKHSEIEVEEGNDDLKSEAEESQEAWRQTLASFKEQALKMRSISQEAYEIYSQKAIIVLKETSEQLKIQADKAREDLSVIAKEISEDGKEYLSTAAENSPEPLKEIVQTFSSSPDDLKEVSEVQDFYLGIPYGLLLCVGGFLSFMLTGSISAIRFGVILGGTLLALSISSLRAYNRKEPITLPLKGQAAIASILLIRELRLLSQRPSFLSYFTTFISGAMVAFYLYRIFLNRDQSKGSNWEKGTES